MKNKKVKKLREVFEERYPDLIDEHGDKLDEFFDIVYCVSANAVDEQLREFLNEDLDAEGAIEHLPDDYKEVFDDE